MNQQYPNCLAELLQPSCACSEAEKQCAAIEADTQDLFREGLKGALRKATICEAHSDIDAFHQEQSNREEACKVPSTIACSYVLLRDHFMAPS